MSSVALWWIRRDLRLTDNAALAAALRHAHQVIPVFILDPIAHHGHSVSQRRLAFLYEALRSLDSALRKRGSRLVVRYGKPDDLIPALVRESGATAVFAEEDYSPYARQRDARVAKHVPLHLTPGVVIHPPETVRTADDKPYTVFTPFARAWRALPSPSRSALLPPPTHLPPVPDEIVGDPIPTIAGFDWSHVPPSEQAAQEQLEHFCHGDEAPIFRYHHERNWLDGRGSSRLSPYFRFGLLSARSAFVTAMEARAKAKTEEAKRGVDAWINELIWREFYVNILAHFPHVVKQNFRQVYNNFPWENDSTLFAAWREGMTGYPVVDAAMRQLREEGWISNRARMIVASFLAKDLLVHWRWGERWFWAQLIDGDPAANNGGWQWTAGTGTDAAPFFRIFHPVKQGEQFDPDGRYVRRWVPALAHVPDHFIHHPWDMPADLQRKTGCRIGDTYPAPLVDHEQARQRALRLLQQLHRDKQKRAKER